MKELAKNREKDLESQNSMVDGSPSEAPTLFWHIEQTLKFATMASVAFAAYNFASFSFSLFPGISPRKEEAAPTATTATAPRVTERRTNPAPTCPNTTLWGQQQYTGAGFQAIPVATSFNGTATVAFLNTPGATTHMSLGTASLTNPTFNLNVLPYVLDLGFYNKANPGVGVNAQNQTVVFDNGFNVYQQTARNALNGIKENYLSSDTFTSYRPAIATNDTFTATAFATQACSIGNLQIARRTFGNAGAMTNDACVSTRTTYINDNAKVAVSPTTMYAWTSQFNSTSVRTIWFRDENASGFVQPAEVLITTPQNFPHHDCIIQQIKWLNDGSRVVLLTAKDQTNPTLGYAPYIQLMSANGTLTGAPIQIPSIIQNYYYERMGLTVVSDGFVVAGGNDASGAGVVYLQKYNNQGQPQGSRVNLPQLGSFQPTITTLPNDCLMVAYQDPSNHVSTQIFCPNINLQSTAQGAVSYTENGNAINLPPLYIPQVYTYTPGQIVINIAFPANAGTVTAGGQSSSNGSLQITANNFAQANQILNCISYVQADNFANSFDVTVTVSDGISPPSTVTQLVTGIPINVAAVVNTASFVIPQGATVTITPSMLNITDVDTPPQNITISISNPNNGYFQRVGTNGTITPNILQFTYDEVLAGNVQIVAQGSAAISFQLSVSDSKPGLLPNNSAVFTPNIYFVQNQQETLLVNQEIIINQEQSTVITNNTLLAASNKDPSQVLFNVATIAHAQIQRFDDASNTWTSVSSFTQQDINNGWIRIQSDNSGQAPVVVYTYGDSLWASSLQALTFNFNAAPVVRVAQINIDSTQPYQLNENNLLATDSSASSAQLTFTIPKDSQLSGFFAYSKDLKTPIYQFTQADVSAGSVYFVPNKNSHKQDIQAAISVSDGILSMQKELDITFTIPKLSLTQQAQQAFSNPGMGTLLGLIGSYLGFKTRQKIQEHRRDIVNTFAERVRAKLNLDIVDFRKDINGKEFAAFIEDLITVVDAQMATATTGKGAQFRVREGTTKHEWSYLKKAQKYREYRDAEADLDELAEVFATHIKQHRKDGQGLCLPQSVYTWTFGYWFKYDEAVSNKNNLATRIMQDLAENKQKIGGSIATFIKQKSAYFLGNNRTTTDPDSSLRSLRGGRVEMGKF